MAFRDCAMFVFVTAAFLGHALLWLSLRPFWTLWVWPSAAVQRFVSLFVHFFGTTRRFFCRRGLFRLRVDSVLWAQPLGAGHAILVFIAAAFRAVHRFCLSLRPFRAARQLHLFVVAGFLGHATIPFVGAAFWGRAGFVLVAAAFRSCTLIFSVLWPFAPRDNPSLQRQCLFLLQRLFGAVRRFCLSSWPFWAA